MNPAAHEAVAWLEAHGEQLCASCGAYDPEGQELGSGLRYCRRLAVWRWPGEGRDCHHFNRRENDMARQPDSRASLGQRIEDELDAITEATRRQTNGWIDKLMRGAPDSKAQEAAIIGGIAGGLLDRLWELSRGEPDKVRDSWGAFAEGYLGAAAEDVEADAEDGAAEGPADA